MEPVVMAAPASSAGAGAAMGEAVWQKAGGRGTGRWWWAAGTLCGLERLEKGRTPPPSPVAITVKYV